MNQRCLWIVAAMLLSSAVANAQDKKKDESEQKPVKENPAHEELREVKKGMEEAFNKKDLDALLKYVHKDAVVTWQNGEVSRGHAGETKVGHKGIKEYYDRMLSGDKSILSKVEAKPDLEEFSILYGDPPTTAVAYGKLKDKYYLRDGTTIDMDSRFSATLVKEDGKWLIVSFHGSADVFNNAVMKMAITKVMWITAGAVGLGALLVGLIVGRLMGGKKAA